MAGRLSEEGIPTLAERMRALAHGGHERAVELIEKADALEAAAKGLDVRKMVGAWARARRLFCEITGESLI